MSKRAESGRERPGVWAQPDRSAGRSCLCACVSGDAYRCAGSPCDKWHLLASMPGRLPADTLPEPVHISLPPPFLTPWSALSALASCRALSRSPRITPRGQGQGQCPAGNRRQRLPTIARGVGGGESDCTVVLQSYPAVKGLRPGDFLHRLQTPHIPENDW